MIEEDYGTDDDEWCDPYAGIHFKDVAEVAASMRPAAAGDEDEAAVAARSDGAVTIAVGQQLPPPPAEPFQPPPPRGQRGAGLTLSSR